MVPFLYNFLKEILTLLLQIFILNDTIKKADTMVKLMKTDTNDVNLHKPFDLIQIDTAAKLHVANYKKSIDSDRYCCKVACWQLQEKHIFQGKYSLKIL